MLARLKRLMRNGPLLLLIGLICAVTAWLTGAVSVVWAAIVFIASGVMRLRIGSPVYMETGPFGGEVIGGEGNSGD